MADGVPECHVDAACEEQDVDGDEGTQDSDEHEAAQVLRGGIANEVAEAQDQVQDAQCGHFVQDFHVVGKGRVKWPEPTQYDD